MISKYELKLKNNDVERIQKSTFIPHYKSLKPKLGLESYLNGKTSIRLARLIAQIRLNKFSIKLDNTYIPLNQKCRLCNSPNVATLEHYMFECPILKPSRTIYLGKYILPNSVDSNLALKSLLLSKRSKNLYIDILNFWSDVTIYYDLSDMSLD